MINEVQQYFWTFDNRFTNILDENSSISLDERKIATAQDFREYISNMSDEEIAKRLDLVHKQTPSRGYKKPRLL